MVLCTSHDHYKMRRQQYQQTIAKNLFNYTDAVSDPQHSLISGLLDKIAQLEADQKSQAIMRDEKDALYKRIDAKIQTVWECCNMLLTKNVYTTSTIRERMLSDMSRTTLDYAQYKDQANEDLKEANDALLEEIDELRTKCQKLEQRDAANDAGSTPPAHNTITRRQIKNRHDKEAPDTTPAKIGPPEGHAGHARQYNPDGRINLTLDTCPDCGSPIGEIDRYSKTALELEDGRVTERLYDVYLYICGTCGPVSSKPDWMLDGTSIGKKLLIKIVRLYHTNKSGSELCETIHIAYDKKLCRATINNAIRASEFLLKPEIKTIRNNIAKSSAGNIDDTVLPLGPDRSSDTGENDGKDKDNDGKDNDGKDKDNDGKDKDNDGKDKDNDGKDKDNDGKDKDNDGKDNDGKDSGNVSKNGRMWVMIGDGKHVMFHPAETRRKSVIEKNFPYPDIKMTCDAYAAHNHFKTRQLCWAHVKTKVENAVTKSDTETGWYLYHRLMSIYQHAKGLPPDTPEQKIDRLILETTEIGRLLLQEGIKAGTYVCNCAPYLFTAVTNPEMSLTNNLAERMLRRFVIRRKVMYRFATLRGAQMYCTIASILETWKLHGSNAQTEFERLFGT